MENVIDYTEQLNYIVTHLPNLEETLIEISQSTIQTNYLLMFLFGVLIAVALIILLKGLS